MLYRSYTMQMHGKNRSMLRGYRSDNTKIASVAPHMTYADPATRYNGYRDVVFGEWADAVNPARLVRSNKSSSGGSSALAAAWLKVGSRRASELTSSAR